jgi:osmotically inducible lipoprotein OsmB
MYVKALSALALAVALGGCGDSMGERALSGGALGAGAGAATGAVVGGGALEGAVIGGALGAAAGAVTTDNDDDYDRWD